MSILRSIARRAMLPALGALILAPTLAACSASDPATSSAATSVSDAPKDGGTLNIGLNAALTCLDPHQNASNVTIYVSRNIADSLTDQDPGTGDLKPWLAEKWEVNDDATAITFHLRPGITFTDGTPLDSAAVKANFDSIKQLGNAKAFLANSYLSDYDTTEVVDATTFVVHFSKPNIQFLQGTSTVTLGIFSAANVAKSADERCAGDLVGSGPFSITSYKPDTEIDLAKNPAYDWPSELRTHTGAAHLDAVDFKVVTENGVRSGQLSSGALDLDTIPLTEDLDRFSGNGFSVVGRPYPGLVINLGVNLSRPLLQDVDVRRALLVGIDRDSLVSNVLSKFDKPATGVLSSATPFYSADDQIRYDPTQAESLLDAAGWVKGSDGIRSKDGQRLSLFLYFATFRQSAQVAQVLQQQLKAIGVELKVQEATPAQAAEYSANGDYDFSYSYFIRADPDVLKANFSTEYSNASHAQPDEKLDGLLDLQATQSAPAARQKTVDEAQKILLDQVYLIPLFEFAQLVTKSDAVHDFTLDGTSRLNLYDTWLDRA